MSLLDQLKKSVEEKQGVQDAAGDTTAHASETSTPTDTAPSGASTQEQHITPPQVEINDESTLKYLREIRGIDIDSIDAIGKKPEPIGFASAEVESFNVFAQETGRGLDDYLKLQKDWKEVDDVSIAREHYLQRNPGASAADFDLMNDLDLQPLEGEDYSESQVSERNRTIAKRDATIRHMASEGRRYFDEISSKIKAPIEGYNANNDKLEQGRQAWESAVKEASANFDLGIEGYKHDVPVETLQNRYSSPDKILQMFKNDNGVIDMTKLMTTIELGLSHQKISAIQAEALRTSTTEGIVKDLERPSGSGLKPESGTSSASAEVSEFLRRQINRV